MAKWIPYSDDAIDDLLERFDFSKVYVAMKAVGWTWWDSPETPTPSRLQQAAVELLREANKRGTTISTGGFFATADEHELTLEFSLTHTSVTRMVQP